MVGRLMETALIGAVLHAVASRRAAMYGKGRSMRTSLFLAWGASSLAVAMLVPTAPSTAPTLLACVGVSAVTDLETGYIFDAVVAPAGIVAAVSALCSGTAGDAAIGCFACGALLLGLRVVSGGNIGLGDVKLGCLIGTIGPVNGIISLGTAFVAGAVYVTCGRAFGHGAPKRYVPFAPFLAFGTFASLLRGAYW